VANVPKVFFKRQHRQDCLIDSRLVLHNEVPSAIVITLPQPDQTGAAKMALAFAREFVRREYAVVLLHGAVRSGHKGILDEFHSIGAIRISNPAFGPAISPSVFRWMIREMKRANPIAAVSMFVTTDTKYVGPASRILGIPHVSAVQNDLVLYGDPVMRWLKSALFGAIYRSTVDLAVCTSEKVRLSLARERGMPKDRLAVLPNGVETARVSELSLLERSAIRKELGVAEDEVLLVNVGRLHPQKGQDVLVEAISRLDGSIRPRIKLILIGDSDAGKPEACEFASALRGQVAGGRLGQIVHFSGWRNDVPAVLQAADIYVHSAKWEGPPFPLAILEAMACGLPVVMTDCAGRPEEFIDGHHGYCVEAGQANHLAIALTKLLSEKPGRLRDIGKNCQKLVAENFEISTISKRFVDLALSITMRSSKAT
jgi:glycosyltransferase involved in cell wall biosynthesis